MVKRGRSLVKKYGVIFTYLAIRAVHIEVASSLDTDSCLNAKRLFVARRAHVKVRQWDLFVAAEHELRQSIEKWNNPKIQDHLSQQGIKWVFNPPTGSHHVGVWERLIRSIRKILNAVATSRFFKFIDFILLTSTNRQDTGSDAFHG